MGKRKESYFFRLVGLDKKLLHRFEGSISGHKVEYVKHYENHTILVASFEIRKDYDYKMLRNFIVDNISDKSYGIYISLVTNRDNDGIHVPDYILQFYAFIGGNIDFSFVSIE